jgi:hypothetical protein
MWRLRFSILPLLLVVSAVFAAQVHWLGTDGKPIPDEDARRSVGGFGGWLVVTPDADWEKKWDTPSDTMPAFTTAEKVHRGQTLSILIFYANPQVDSHSSISVSCDFRVTRPNGTRSIDAKHMRCASGPIAGEPTALRLSNQLLKFIGEAGDPLGKWTVEVTLHDEHAKLTVPLETEFDLLP